MKRRESRKLPQVHVWPALISLPFAGLIHRFASEPRGVGFNRILVQKFQALFSVLLCLGMLMSFTPG